MAEIQAIEPDDTVVTPPDELVAQEFQAIEQFKAKGKGGPSKNSNVVASTSSATSGSSSNIKMNIHLQDTSAKYRQTPAARKREQMNDAMFNLVKETHKQILNDNEEDDALDLSFASMAKRMRTNLNEKQLEKVHIAIQTLVNTAIDNAEIGLPVVPRPPNLLQPIRNPTPPPQPNFMGPPPPTATPVDPNTSGGGGDYYQAGPPPLQMFPQF